MYHLENLNVVIGNSHNEGEESDFVGLTGGPDSQNCENSAERNYYSSSNSGENEIRGFAGNGHSSSEIGPDNNLDSLTGEINQRISEEVNVLIDTSNLQIQRAINEAINEQVSPKNKSFHYDNPNVRADNRNVKDISGVIRGTESRKHFETYQMQL